MSARPILILRTAAMRLRMQGRIAQGVHRDDAGHLDIPGAIRYAALLLDPGVEHPDAVSADVFEAAGHWPDVHEVEARVAAVLADRYGIQPVDDDPVTQATEMLAGWGDGYYCPAPTAEEAAGLLEEIARTWGTRKEAAA